MLGYRKRLKPLARTLRSNMTDAEQLLWSRLRRKQLKGLQFYRQKPLGGFIVDFYCHSAKLVIELVGSQHLEPVQQRYDTERTQMLKAMGLTVIRFPNDQVLGACDDVLERVYRVACGNPP